MFDTQEVKRKNRSPLRVIVNAWGCLLGIIMLALGLIVGMLASVYFLPSLFDYDLTITALSERELLLIATAADLQSREQALSVHATEQALNYQRIETQFALSELGTQAALENARLLLGQTATQSQGQINGTIAAATIQNEQRRTQIALDFAATQAQLQQNATQVEIDFRNTKAALGGDFEAQAVNPSPVAPSLTPSSPSLRPTLTPSPMLNPSLTNEATRQTQPTLTSPPTGILLPPTDTPSARESSRLDLQFPEDALLGAEWQNVEAWLMTDLGLEARSEGAWLLSENAYGEQVTIAFSPAIVLNSEYWFFYQVQKASSGYALKVVMETLAAREIVLYRFEGAQISNLAPENLELLHQSRLDNLLRSTSRIEFRRIGTTLTISLNDASLLVLDVETTTERGQVGVQFPQGALLQVLAAD